MSQYIAQTGVLSRELMDPLRKSVHSQLSDKLEWKIRNRLALGLLMRRAMGDQIALRLYKGVEQ